MNSQKPRKMNNWKSELYYSMPKSFQVGGPSEFPKPIGTPFRPKAELPK